jgi:hypothetical protein
VRIGEMNGRANPLARPRTHVFDRVIMDEVHGEVLGTLLVSSSVLFFGIQFPPNSGSLIRVSITGMTMMSS